MIPLPTSTTALVTVMRDGIRDQRVVTLPQRRERGAK